MFLIKLLNKLLYFINKIHLGYLIGYIIGLILSLSVIFSFTFYGVFFLNFFFNSFNNIYLFMHNIMFGYYVWIPTLIGYLLIYYISKNRG